MTDTDLEPLTENHGDAGDEGVDVKDIPKNILHGRDLNAVCIVRDALEDLPSAGGVVNIDLYTGDEVG